MTREVVVEMGDLVQHLERKMEKKLANFIIELLGGVIVELGEDLPNLRSPNRSGVLSDLDRKGLKTRQADTLFPFYNRSDLFSGQGIVHIQKRPRLDSSRLIICQKYELNDKL